MQKYAERWMIIYMATSETAGPPGLRVRDLVEEPALGLEVVVEGDLDAALAWVHVSELADPRPFLHGGELILSAGVWRGRGTSAAEFVGALASRAVVGVGWGLLDEAPQVPSDIVTACRDAGITLVAVPVRTPFIAVTRWHVERVARAREAALRESLAFSRALLAAAEDDPRGPAAGADVALARVGALVADELGRAVAVDERAGSLLVDDEDALDPVQQSRLEAARPVVGLVLARRRAVAEAERRLAGEAVSLVMTGQDAAARTRLASYDVDPDGPMRAVVLQLGDGGVVDQAAVAARVAELLAGRGTRAVVGGRGDQLDVVMAAAPWQTDASAETLAAALLRSVGGTAAGVGELSAGLDGLRRGVLEAREACRLAARGRPGAVVVHRSRGRHRTLLALHHPEVLEEFAGSVLGPVAEYDRVHGSALVPTLRRFLELDGGWKRTAADLDLHVNTLRQRLARVEVLTGRSLERTADRVDLWLALRATPGA